jgi:hypothetical protein
LFAQAGQAGEGTGSLEGGFDENETFELVEGAKIAAEAAPTGSVFFACLSTGAMESLVRGHFLNVGAPLGAINRG